MKLIHFTALIFGLLLVACKNDAPNEKNTDSELLSDKTEDEKSIPIVYPEEAKFDDAATFLAGVVDTDNSSLSGLESTVAFKSFRSEIDLLWKQTNEKLPAIKNWTKSELKEINEEGGNLFYPFAGADFLHADLFFPNYDTIVFFALEPIGTFPDLNQKYKDSTLDGYMAQLKKSMKAILGLSFFRTIAMADDFKSELDGTLPVFMHFMKRTGHDVMYQQQVAILPNGDVTTDISSLPDSSYIGNRYYIKRKGEENVRAVYYFSLNIQNTPYIDAKGLDTRKDVLAFLDKQDFSATYLKSASYLLHRPSFSIIRNFILNNSEYLLQDDSGIPLNFFDESKWDLTFYGDYKFPISLFAERHQEDLKKAYAEKGSNVKELPFGIGYQYKKGTSNLMLARKKKK
jgi:hypothetical protein